MRTNAHSWASIDVGNGHDKLQMVDSMETHKTSLTN